MTFAFGLMTSFSQRLIKQLLRVLLRHQETSGRPYVFRHICIHEPDIITAHGSANEVAQILELMLSLGFAEQILIRRFFPTQIQIRDGRHGAGGQDFAALALCQEFIGAIQNFKRLDSGFELGSVAGKFLKICLLALR